jgi:hypothetical protein
MLRKLAAGTSAAVVAAGLAAAPALASRLPHPPDESCGDVATAEQSGLEKVTTPPDGTVVDGGDTIQVVLRWDEDTIDGPVMDRALDCVEIDGRPAPELDLEERAVPNNGRVSHSYRIPAGLAPGTEVCDQGFVFGPPADVPQRLSSNRVCFTVAPPQAAPSPGTPGGPASGSVPVGAGGTGPAAPGGPAVPPSGGGPAGAGSPGLPPSGGPGPGGSGSPAPGVPPGGGAPGERGPGGGVPPQAGGPSGGAPGGSPNAPGGTPNAPGSGPPPAASGPSAPAGPISPTSAPPVAPAGPAPASSPAELAGPAGTTFSAAGGPGEVPPLLALTGGETRRLAAAGGANLLAAGLALIGGVRRGRRRRITRRARRR